MTQRQTHGARDIHR